jgi:hypothetical protein
MVTAAADCGTTDRSITVHGIDVSGNNNSIYFFTDGPKASPILILFS